MARKTKNTYGAGEITRVIQEAFAGQEDGTVAVIDAAGKPDPCLYSLYASPLSTPSLAYNAHARDGFKFEVQSPDKEQAIFDTPEDEYDLLVALNKPGYRTVRIYRKTGQPVAVVRGSITVIRIQDGFPTEREINKAFRPLKAKPAYLTLHEGRPTPRRNGSEATAVRKTDGEGKLPERIRLRFTGRTHTA